MKILLFFLLLTVSTVSIKVERYCCKWYIPQPGDSCTKIANFFRVGKEKLVALNGYDMAKCELGESVCLDRSDFKPTCKKWYRTVGGDSCVTIWRKHGMTATQFLDYHEKGICYPLKPQTEVCTKIWYDDIWTLG